MQKSTWHFARPKLAEAYLKAFDLGLVSAKGLFARRRMGKTEFLKQDLMPAAEQAGYLTVYVNLWDMRDDPARALTVAFYQAIQPKGAAGLLDRLKKPVKKVKASGKAAGAEGTLEAEFGDVAGAPHGTVLMDAMKAYDKKPRPLLLIIDEAQVLATQGNSDFAHALRAALDIRRDTIKVLFAGSSEATLRRMFGRSSEPFYNWAQLEPFQLLGRDFVEAMVEKVAALSTRPLAITDALHAFAELKNTPLFFRAYLDRYITHAFDGHEEALAHTRQHVFNDESFQLLWQATLPADRAVLSLIANRSAEILGKEARARVGEALGLGKAADASTLSNALRRLVEKNIIARMEHGKYQFEDEAYAEWVRNQAMEE